MGKSELFISFKKNDGGWSKAVKFNKTINATFTENIPNVTPDGKYFFFHRNNDIYWVSAKVIDEMRKKVLGSKARGGSYQGGNLNLKFKINNL